METIRSAIERNQSASPWARWIAIGKSPASIHCRDFLDRALLRVNNPARSRVLKRIQSVGAAQLDATLYELAAHEFLSLLPGVAPTMDPRVATEQTPDLSINIDGQQFIADVFVTHSPQSTYGDRGDETGWAKDSGERAQKIADRLAEKSSKYAALAVPLIQIVFLGDHRILSLQDVEVALYGVALSEFVDSDSYPRDFYFEQRRGGILLPDGERPRYPHLSAVLAIDWFDTLNHKHPGRRFACRLLNHYQPNVRLRSGALSPFQEIRWNSCGVNAWRPESTGESAIVARCDVDQKIEFGRYSGDNPW